MTMEGHGGGGGGDGNRDGNRDQKCIGCHEMDLELSLSLASPPEDPLPPVVSQGVRELLPPQSEQQQQPPPSLSSRNQVLRAGPAATAQPCHCPAAPPGLAAASQPCHLPASPPIAAIRPEQPTHPPIEARRQAPPPTPPPITGVRPAFARSFDSVHSNGQPTHPSVSPPAPPPVGARQQACPLAPPPAGRPPFPWTGDCPATVRPINWLRANGITHIHGEVRCGSCGVQKVVSYELESKAEDTRDFMMKHRHYIDDHTRSDWSKVNLLPCDSCGGSECVGPVIPARDEDINGLFMLRGQTLGALSLAQLKNFCGQTRSHRTGAKTRLLVNIYVKLCRQLIPDWKINADPKNDK